MNEQEYMERLHYLLRALPEEEKLDIILDMKEYFMEGRDDGKTDEELAASLGSPEVIATELLEMNPETLKRKPAVTLPASSKIITESYSHLAIHSKIGSVTVRPSDSDETFIELSGSTENTDLQAVVIHDTLQINVKNKGQWMFLFSFRTKSVQLHVSVPKKLYDSIALKSDNGTVDAMQLIGKRVSAESDNGRILLSDIAAHELKADTDNGLIEITKAEMGQCSAKTDNGRILIQHAAADQIVCKTSNGRIELHDVAGNVKAKSNNGRLIYHPNRIDSHAELETSNGSIDVQLNMPVENAVIYAKTSMGRVSVFGHNNEKTVIGNGTAELHLRSANGRITVQ